MSFTSEAQTNEVPVDRLGVPGPLSFDNTSYSLSWSAHPTSAYYKQEYLPKGADPSEFKTMLMVEVATGPVTAKEAMEAKVLELKRLGAGNPFISYQSSYDKLKDEYLLDFVITKNSADGMAAIIAERNIYRYRNLPHSSAKTGIQLYALSTRAYGNETKNFLAALKTNRSVLVDKFRNNSFPPITARL